MGTGLTIFDMDDVMYYLNRKVARIKNIDEKKFTQFSIFDNPNMTEEEKQRVISAYKDADTYRDIEFIQPVVDLINHVYHEYPEHPVHIVSNCSTQAIADVKMEQLIEVLDLPEERIHLNVINMYTQSLQKSCLMACSSLWMILYTTLLCRTLPTGSCPQGCIM